MLAVSSWTWSIWSVTDFCQSLRIPREISGWYHNEKSLANLLLLSSSGTTPRAIRCRSNIRCKRKSRMDVSIMADGKVLGYRADDHEDAVYLYMPIEASVGAKQINYRLENNRLTLGLLGSKPLISDEELQGGVLHEECAWTIEKDNGQRTLVLELVKKDACRWSSLFKGFSHAGKYRKMISIGNLIRRVESDFDDLRIHKIKSNAHAQKSQIREAGHGLFASRDLEVGCVAALYAVHGMQDLVQKIGVAFREGVTVSDFSRTHSGPVGHPGWEEFLIGIDASKANPPGWLGSLVNDAANCNSSRFDEIASYYDNSLSRANCIFCRLGPPPFTAVVTTRSVKAGEELFLTYGVKYWHEFHGMNSTDVIESREVAERDLETQERINARLFRANDLICKNYEKEIIELRTLDLDIRAKYGDWKPLGCPDPVAIGTLVRVIATMLSSDEVPVEIVEGMRGSVENVNEEGDISIRFIGVEHRRYWVGKHDFKNLEYLSEGALEN